MSETYSLVSSDTIKHCLITLRRFVVVEIFLTISVVFVGLAETPFLPPLLREFQNQAYASFRVTDFLLLAIALPLLVLMIVTWVALWRGWRGGRIMYTIVWISTVPILLLAGPSVRTPIHALVDTAASLVGGLILGFLYFSDIRRLYDEPYRENLKAHLQR